MRRLRELVPAKKKFVGGPRRWRWHQVDDDRYGGVKRVDQLTEAEAKDELCEAQDLIAKLQECARMMEAYGEQYKY